MAKKITISHRLLLGLALLGDLFEDTVGYSSACYHSRQLWLLTPPGYKRPNYYSTLCRLLRTKKIERLIIKGVPTLRLTAQGKNYLNRSFDLIRWQQRRWNKRWCVVSFDLPEKQRYLRNKLRKKLKELGFGQWQQSVYISPYDFVEDLVDFLKSEKLYGQAWVLTAEHRFLGNPKEFARKIWHLDQLNEKYQNLYQKFEKATKPSQELYDSYLNLLIQDPLLPQELLPQPWWGSRIKQNLM